MHPNSLTVQPSAVLMAVLMNLAIPTQPGKPTRPSFQAVPPNLAFDHLIPMMTLGKNQVGSMASISALAMKRVFVR